MKKALISQASAAFIFLFLCGLSGCENPAVSPKKGFTPIMDNAVYPNGFPSASKETQATIFKPFFIYSDKSARDNHYVPSGFMPDGKCVTLNDAWSENCQSGSTCIRIVYGAQCSKENQNWGGIYWLNPPNNWGTRKGGYNLTGARRLVFWARGEEGTEQIEEFTVGGISGNYPDSDMAVLGPVILSKEWREYTIDLRGKDMSYISGGFAWSTNADVNPDTCIFYLDNMRFE